MRPIQETQRYMIILLLFILLAISGLTPHSHLFKENLHKANSAIAVGKKLQAVQSLADAADQQPWQINLWEKAGHYALEGDDPKAALTYLEKATTKTGHSGYPPQQELTIQGLSDLGQAYQQINDLDAAFETWKKAERLYGPSCEILKQRVSTYLARGDFPLAIMELQRMIDLQPEDSWSEYQLGLLIATQEPDKAIIHLEKAAELDPELSASVEIINRGIRSASYVEDPAYSLLSAGRALASINEWGFAAEAFRQAILTKPGYAEAWAYLGEARQHLSNQLTSQQNSSDGLPEIQTSLELDPESLAAHSFLALYWKRQGRYELALEAMQIAAGLDLNNPLLQSELGGIQAVSGNLEGAYHSYLSAVELTPNDPAYKRNLVVFSLAYDYQIEEIALPIARRLVIDYKQDPSNLDLIAQVMIKLGDLENAERFLKRSLAIDPNYGPAHLHLGLVYVLGSDQEKAFQEFNLAQSLSLDSNDPTAEHARRLLRTYFPK